jgi:hypothetical protein
MPKQTILSRTTNHNLLANQSLNQPIALRFEDNSTAILPNNNPLSGLWIKKIRYLQKSGRPAYVTTDNDGVITEVLMPVEDKVHAIDDAGTEAVAVILYVDSAVYLLERDNTDFEALLSVLKDAHNKGKKVLIAASMPGYQIVDVRLPAGDDEESIVVQQGGLGSDSFEKLTLVSPEKAEELFDRAWQQNCSPCDQKNGCIPFMYPGSGCWVRAHLMCFMFLDMKIIPGKAWCNGSNPTLKAWTANEPKCSVGWAYHVAPIVLVNYNDGPRPMVIDPSLCTEPVTPDAWKALMDQGSAKLSFSDWENYVRGSSADPEKAEHDIIEYRINLMATCKSEDGPPPYANCKRPK